MNLNLIEEIFKQGKSLDDVAENLVKHGYKDVEMDIDIESDHIKVVAYKGGITATMFIKKTF